MRNLLTLFDLTSSEVREIIDLAIELKQKWRNGVRPPLLERRVLALLFSKPSLRTRVSFEAAMTHLGGSSLYLGQDVGWQQRESAADFGRVLSQYSDAIVCRTHEHQIIDELASHADCPVINGLTDYAHPCQALADVLTLHELRGSLSGAKFVFVGDGNNVARSLAVVGAHLGMQFVLAAPADYLFDDEFVDRLHQALPKAQLEMSCDPHEAVRQADAVYTDVWSSMGQEHEAEKRRVDFAGFQVNEKLMMQAPQAVFLHCLPAHRGEEVTAEVIDGPQSAIVAQAANRMHVQKAILAWLLR